MIAFFRLTTTQLPTTTTTGIVNRYPICHIQPPREWPVATTNTTKTTHSPRQRRLPTLQSRFIYTHRESEFANTINADFSHAPTSMIYRTDTRIPNGSHFMMGLTKKCPVFTGIKMKVISKSGHTNHKSKWKSFQNQVGLTKNCMNPTLVFTDWKESHFEMSGDHMGLSPW